MPSKRSPLVLQVSCSQPVAAPLPPPHRLPRLAQPPPQPPASPPRPALLPPLHLLPPLLPPHLLLLLPLLQPRLLSQPRRLLVLPRSARAQSKSYSGTAWAALMARPWARCSSSTPPRR